MNKLINYSAIRSCWLLVARCSGVLGVLLLTMAGLISLARDAELLLHFGGKGQKSAAEGCALAFSPLAVFQTAQGRPEEWQEEMVVPTEAVLSRPPSPSWAAVLGYHPPTRY